jgi:hypothetical protein
LRIGFSRESWLRRCKTSEFETAKGLSGLFKLVDLTIWVSFCRYPVLSLTCFGLACHLWKVHQVHGPLPVSLAASGTPCTLLIIVIHLACLPHILFGLIPPFLFIERTSFPVVLTFHAKTFGHMSAPCTSSAISAHIQIIINQIN